MQMEQWENGCLTILLSDRELSGMGVRFPDMDCREPATRKVLRALLENAYAQAGVPPAKRLQIEALPVASGCLLLVTPLARRRAIRMRRKEKPRIYAVADTDDLLRLAEALRRWHEVPPLLASSLYRWDKEYRLVVYPARTPSRLWLILSEFGRPVGQGDVPTAVVEEHGRLLARGDALEQLMTATPPMVG